MDSKEHEVERLLVRARPIIDAVLARFMRSDRALRRDEIEDVASTAALRLLRRLREGPDSIADFDDYVATLTYRTVYDFMRRRYPERTRLKNRLRYLLQHDPRLALWRSGDVIACGLAEWSGRAGVLEGFTISRESSTAAMRDSQRPNDAAVAILESARAPLSLETLVRVAAELWDVAEARIESVDERAPQRAPSHAARAETRQFLQILWNEIKLLQPAHRTALLLNLRDTDGVNAIALFVLVGVAKFEEIADAIGMTNEELEAVWDSLPIDDLTIASKLNVSRQQVINLRRSARERLARRTLTFARYERRRS